MDTSTPTSTFAPAPSARSTSTLTPPPTSPPPLPPVGPPAVPYAAPAGGPSRGAGGRGRFLAGALAGVALTGAAVGGGYAIGRDASSTGADDTGAVAAETVTVGVDGDATIADLVTAVRPSIVSVHQTVTQSSPFGTVEGQAAGTGFVLAADGYIVTNAHVVADGDDTVVTFADGSTEPAEIVAADASRDLAVLRVERTDLVPLAVGDSDDLRLGEQVVAIGYALDLDGEPSVTTGILSAAERTITTENGERLVNLLQTDTAINPGNSGGPLLNLQGEVVGINTAIAGEAQNIGFAIAITPVQAAIDSLREGEVPQRTLMGVTTRVPEPTDTDGAEIVEIAAGSGADRSDLAIGDVIVAVDDVTIDSPDDLGVAIATRQPGDEVTVTVVRDGAATDVTVVLGAAD